MVTCYECGGTVERRRIASEHKWGEQRVLVENVPAWVCEDCGETYLDARTCLELERMRSEPPPPTRHAEVPVYAFANSK